MLQWGLFGWGSPPIKLQSESSYVEGVELSEQLFTITAKRTRCPLQSVSGEEIMDLLHSRETSRKDPPLQCKGPCRDSFISETLRLNKLDTAHRHTTGWSDR